MSSPDKPFELRGGGSEQVALHNRIAVMKRIEHLTGVDLSKKSTEFIQKLDLKLWTRWYKKLSPDRKVNEKFCQRAAEVVKELENDKEGLCEEDYAKAKNEHKSKLKAKNDTKNTPVGAGNVKKADQQDQNRVLKDPPGAGD